MSDSESSVYGTTVSNSSSQQEAEQEAEPTWPTTTTVVRAGDVVTIEWTPTHRSVFEFAWRIKGDEVADVWLFDSLREMRLLSEKLERDAQTGVSVDAVGSLVHDVDAYLTGVRVDVGLRLLVEDGLAVERADGSFTLTEAAMLAGMAGAD